MRRGNVHIGTSGWSYEHWVGPFYPDGLPPGEFLDFYARRFATVEVNNTFYQLPSPTNLAAWREATPANFRFACKASRYITHMKKLKDPRQSTSRFFEAVEPLAGKLGPILFQLPPHWHADPGRLGAFLEVLPNRYRFAFEFRDVSWFIPEVYDLLARHNVAFCIYDLARRRSPDRLTADFAYVRLHGPDGSYQGKYDGRTLFGWARKFRTWREKGIDVYCYFDNDERGYAAEDARRLGEMIERLNFHAPERAR